MDGLRGIAAFAVVFFHIGGVLPWQPFPNGYLAVDFFFLLSGFVLAGAYEKQLASDLGFKQYIARRLTRFYPSILAGLALGIVAALNVYPTNPVVLWAALQVALLPVTLGANPFPLNPPQWSLTFEVIANVVHAAAVRRLELRALFVLVGVSAVGLALALQGEPGERNWLFPAIARTAFSFFLGVAFWRLHAVGRLRVPTAPAWLLFGVLALILFGPLPVWSPLRDLGITMLVWPSLLALAINARQPVALRSMASFAGRISYPLYAIHYPIIVLCLPLILTSGSLGWMRGLIILCFVIACVVIAVAVEKFIERPLITWKQRPASVTRSQ